MKLAIYRVAHVSPADFVDFWARRYDCPDDCYTKNIEGRPTPKRIEALFGWKKAGRSKRRLTRKQMRSIKQHFINRASELSKMPKTTDAKTFLERFSSGGGIFRIFWLHWWQPKHFPMYDQHVHRAMVFMRKGMVEEIPKSAKAQIDSYLTKYKPFFESLSGLDPRLIDKALWAFGKFIKEYQLPTSRMRKLAG